MPDPIATHQRSPQPPARAEARPDVAHGEMFDPAESVSGYERSPEDLLRLLVALGAAVVVIVASKLFERGVNDLQADAVSLVAVSSPDAVRLLEGLLSLVGIVLLAVTVVLPLATRRYRSFGYVLVAAVACNVAIGALDAWIGVDGTTNALAAGSGVSTDLLPDASAVASAAATIVVFGTFATRRWRQVLWWAFAAMVLLQVLVSVHPPVATVVALAVGPAAGSAVLLAFGRPTSRPTPAAIVASLATGGLPVTGIEPASVDARGSTPYFATTVDGAPLFVKVLGAHERAADLLFRLYRRLRLRNVGDERPDSTLRRTVEHEALVSLQARDVGVVTPRMRAVARVGQDSFLLAYDLIPGSSLDGVDADLLDDGALDALWAQVALLRRHRIAHRDLRLANVFLAEDRTVWIIDFGFAEVAADDGLLDADVAQLLASLATSVGVDRATSSGIAALGTEAVAAAIPRLQMVALSGATQTGLRAHPGLLEELRATSATRCGIDQPELEPLTRFRPSHGALLTASALALFLGLPLVVGAGAVLDAVTAADWAPAAWLVAAALGVMTASAWGLYSSAPATLPAWPTLAAGAASTFASTTAPAMLGSTSLRVRYLDRHGLAHRRSVAATAFDGLARMATTATLLVGLLLWGAPRSAAGPGIERPGALWAGAGALAALAALALAVPAVRRPVGRAARAFPDRARDGFRSLAGSPARVGATVAAAALELLASAAALDVPLQVMAAELPPATVVVVVAATRLLASLVPTPGHLGAVEAAGLAALVAAGVDGPSAVAAILLRRLATFWVPVLIGWPAFRWLTGRDHV